MARRPLPRSLRDPMTRGRQTARRAADATTEVLQPLITLVVGLRLLAVTGRRTWREAPEERRGSLLFLAGSAVLIVALVPYGPLLALVGVTTAALRKGRGPARRARSWPGGSRARRLAALYEALVPHFALPQDPDPLYAHGGRWDRAFMSDAFDADGRLSRLAVRYPPYFPDGDAEARARVEQVVQAKSGRGREYHFGWDEEAGELAVSVLPPLPTGVVAQRFGTAPGETVLGFTDPADAPWTLRVWEGEETRERPPVVWRTGPGCPQPHLLAVGRPGSGVTTLLRSVALQALRYGDVLVVDGAGTGAYACLTGRSGVLAVECGLAGARAALEWAARETQRRLAARDGARQAGVLPPEDTGRPLWLLLDRPALLADLAAADGRVDPQALLRIPLRHGRTAEVTVAVGEQSDALDGLDAAVWQCPRARVVLGPEPDDLIETVLGAPPHTTPTAHVPPGRGYARLGAGPVLRLQVPATPDPYDEVADPAHRQAVLDLLPGHTAARKDAPRSGA